MYFIQHCFICRPSNYTVSEDAGIEPRTVATLALAVKRSNLSARSHPQEIFILKPKDDGAYVTVSILSGAGVVTWKILAGGGVVVVREGAGGKGG
jgi:hypothetical protein